MNLSVKSNKSIADTANKSKRALLHKNADNYKSLSHMNFGFKYLSDYKKIDLLYDDEKNRYSIQLYDQVIQKMDLYHKDVLEVGSKRGGGASYLNRYYTPKTYTGLEISDKLVNFCNAYYHEPGLSFLKGDICQLPFEKGSFDLVLNIGTAHESCDVSKFFNEVYRILRDDAFFLFADMIEKKKLETVKHFLRMAGFTIEHKQDLTENVFAAIKETANPDLTKERIPGFMKKAFLPFTRNKDKEIFESFENKESVFMSYVLKRIN